MGRFTCVNCGCAYHEQRFVWESSELEREAPLNDSASGETPSSQEVLERQATDEDFGAAPGEVEAGMEEGVASEDSLLPDAMKRLSIDSLKVYADMTRATGTAANIAGTVAPYLSQVCAPVSAVGGVVGIAGGAAQLHRGIATASQVMDPHLVTKGTITTGTGGICAALGVTSLFVPALFPVTLAIGFLGLGAATTVDATMDGLCSSCRDTPLSDDAQPPPLEQRTGKEEQVSRCRCGVVGCSGLGDHWWLNRDTPWSDDVSPAPVNKC